ncbi:hypothetical protein IMZ48_01525 [Candidatus Bathyarchaeota archaeon]|nr:hypothetical protein [Candidatus Bathyarchaeota archaeon]
MHTVLKTKAPVTTPEYGDRYTLLGRLEPQTVSTPDNHTFEEEITNTNAGPGGVRRAAAALGRDGADNGGPREGRRQDLLRPVARRGEAARAPHGRWHSGPVPRRVEARL